MHTHFHQLDSALYTHVQPQPLKHAQQGHLNLQLLQDLDLDEQFWQQNWMDIISGSKIFDDYTPLAMVYAGHQFGAWAGQLGDGRGLLINQFSHNGKLWDMHLKGAGKTPYSRMGDGRAVLRSTIREYLAGHALTNLGVASSNAVGFVRSQTPVQREQTETGAMLLRVADSHIRLGHFEWIQAYAPHLLQEFTYYVIQTYYPECLESDTPVLAFAAKVVENTAKTIAQWQLIGFAHGVMNTDNLSITGSTLDFGPYGFMQRFNPKWINNKSDYTGRYCYQNQPAMAHWNLAVWLDTLLPLQQHFDYIDKQALIDVLETFEGIFFETYKDGIAKKVGLVNTQQSFDWAMDWLTFIEHAQLDYTNSFRLLVYVLDNPQAVLEQADITINESGKAQYLELITEYQSLHQQNLLPERTAVMNAVNPVYIPRNEMLQKAIEQAERGDMSEVDRLYKLFAQPYAEHSFAVDADITPTGVGSCGIGVSCSS